MDSSLRILAGALFRKLIFFTPLRRFVLYRYQYKTSPQALATLGDLLRRTADVEGMIVEVGCERGQTTVFLNKYMDVARIEKAYLCIDTFAGFIAEDVAFEIEQRGKAERFSSFSVNDIRWFEETMRLNGIQRVEAIQADAKLYDYPEGARISFALVDVDLYKPTAAALPKIWERLSPGGVIVVDDCRPGDYKYDGSLQAYLEFVQTIGEEPEYRAGRLGVINKPEDSP